MKPGRNPALFVVMAALGIGGMAARAFALSYPLSSTAIRDAYFAGNRNDEQTGELLAQYVHRLPMPESGAYVEDIGIDTPFLQIARQSRLRPNYFAPDAVEEFQNKPMSFRVYVDIALTASYSPIPSSTVPEDHWWVPDFWNDFKVQLVQDGDEIPAARVIGGPIYSYGDDEIPMVTGARIVLIYNPEKIESEATRVVVLTPDGQTVETTFNLAKLQ
jgi:hypothetical protein